MKMFKRFNSTITNLVKQTIEQNVQCKGDQWKTLHLKSPSIKFKIINSLMEQTNRKVTNIELSDTRNTDDLIKLFSSKENVFIDELDMVKVKLSQLVQDEKLPENVAHIQKTNKTFF